MLFMLLISSPSWPQPTSFSDSEEHLTLPPCDQLHKHPWDDGSLFPSQHCSPWNVAVQHTKCFDFLEGHDSS